MEPFIAVSCGYAHTLVASESSLQLLGFGWNDHNQVVGSESTDCLLPVVCLEKKKIIKLSCGFAHSAAITSSGCLFIWGKLN